MRGKGINDDTGFYPLAGADWRISAPVSPAG